MDCLEIKSRRMQIITCGAEPGVGPTRDRPNINQQFEFAVAVVPAGPLPTPWPR
jgi:hypothetical protein